MAEKVSKLAIFLGIVIFFTGAVVISQFISEKGLFGFVVFEAGKEANMTAWFNNTDLSSITINTQIYFYANFYNKTNSSVIINDTDENNFYCNFTQNSLGFWSDPKKMTFNSTSQLYEYAMNFSAAGFFDYNITCFGSNYDNVSAKETFLVTNCNVSDGTWTISGKNVFCSNTDVLVNGSINITDSNLTIIGSTFNFQNLSSYKSKLELVNSSLIALGNSFNLNDSNVFILNSSSVLGPNSYSVNSYVEVYNSSFNLNTLRSINSTLTLNQTFADYAQVFSLIFESNSSVNIYNSTIPVQLILVNNTKLKSIDSNISLKFYTYGDMLIENLTFGKYLTLFSNSSSIILNLSNTWISARPMVLANAGKINFSESTIGSFFSSENSNSINSTLASASLSANFYSYNSTILDYFELKSDALNATFEKSKIRGMFIIFGGGNYSINGNLTITDKAVGYFNESARVTRFYDMYLYNNSRYMNGTLNIVDDASNTIWSGQIENSTIFVNLTFDSSTYLNEYRLEGPAGYMGRISFLDDTPINITNVSVCDYPAQGDWIVNANSRCTDTIIQLKGSIFLRPFVNLTLINSSFVLSGANYTNLSTGANLYLANASLSGRVILNSNSTLQIFNSSTTLSAEILNSTFMAFNSTFSSAKLYTAKGIQIVDFNTSTFGNLTIIADLFFNSTESRFDNFEINTTAPINISYSNITRLITANNVLLNNSFLTFLYLKSDSNATIADSTIDSIDYIGPKVSINFSVSTIGRILAIDSDASANASIEGDFQILQKSLPVFSAGKGTKLNRYYSTYFYNGGGLIGNSEFNITYGNQIIWSANTSSGYALVNLTFDEYNFGVQYNLNSVLGYVGKISLLDNTPINRSQRISETPLYVKINTQNNTLINDSVFLDIVSNKEISCQYSLAGAALLNVTKTNSYLLLYNASLLTYNTIIGNAYNKTINSSTLPFLFREDTYSDFVGSTDNDVSYAEELTLPKTANPGSLIFTGEQSALAYPLGLNASTYLFFSNTSSDIVYNYVLKFNLSVNYNNFSADSVLKDLQGSRIKIQGILMNITDVGVNFTNNKIQNITFSNGTSLWILKGSAGRIAKDGIDINNSYGYVLGTPGNWTGLNITFYPAHFIFVSENSSFTDPVFGRFKFMFKKLNRDIAENMIFKSNGDTAYFNFTNSEGMNISIPYYSNGTHIFRGTINSRILAKGENSTVADASLQKGLMFFFVSSGNVSRILNITDIDFTNKQITLQDITYGITYASLNYTNSSANLSRLKISIHGNITLNISSDEKIITYQNTPSTIARTKYGAFISLSTDGVILTETNISRNGALIGMNATLVGSNITLVFAQSMPLLADKYFGNSDLKTMSTNYGTTIDYSSLNLAFNRTLILINYPKTTTYADIYLANDAWDNSTAYPQGKFKASSEYKVNNLSSIVCTDGVETKYFSGSFAVSKAPQLDSSPSTQTFTRSANIFFTTDVEARASISYGKTDSLGTTISNTTLLTDFTVTLTNLTPDTEYVYNLTLCDYYSRCIVSGPYSLTTEHESSAEAELTRNAIDRTTILNINPFASRRFYKLNAGELYYADMSYGRVPISRIEFIPKTNLEKMVFRFYNLKNTSESPSFGSPEKVFAYLKLEMEGAAMENLSSLNISFRIDKPWFQANNFSRTDIAFNRYTDKWNELGVQFEKEDDFYYYYKSPIPGFSYFIISATKGANPTQIEQPTLPQTEPVAQPQTQPQTPAESNRQNTPANNAPKQPEEEQPSGVAEQIDQSQQGFLQNKTMLFGLIGGIVLAIIAISAVVINKNSRNKVQELANVSLNKEEIIKDLRSKGVYAGSLEELRQFVFGSLQQGKTPSDIRATLISVGWEEHIVDEILSYFEVFKQKK